MRLHIQTTANKELVPFNYQHKLVGVLHKWLGKNDLHGKMAMHSFSWLMDAQAQDDGLDFPDGARFFVSFYDVQHIPRLIEGIFAERDLFAGMEVLEINMQEKPDLTERTVFQCASPVFVRRIEGDQNIHYTYEDEVAGELMKETLLNKMQKAGLEPDETLRIRFDTSAQRKKTKLIDYRGVKNRVSFCPVIIEGKPETKVFAWCVGVGASTGIGFGAIY